MRKGKEEGGRRGERRVLERSFFDFLSFFAGGEMKCSDKGDSRKGI